jgi:ubiquinone/menaquinone biosynthesis C-methylase UbiE
VGGGIEMLHNLLKNTRKPTNTLGGRLMLIGMNTGHNPASRWGLKHLDLSANKRILDIGCGGGKNIMHMLNAAPEAIVCGIDYSAASVKKSLKLNKKAVRSGRAAVREASVELIPFADEEFDTVTAFETIYFWPDVKKNFAEVARVLKRGGVFMVCNEAQKPEGSERWIEMLNMTVYTGEEIKRYMEEAGIYTVEAHNHGNGRWLCVTGVKGVKAAEHS